METQLICRVCLKVVDPTTQSFGYIEDATGNLRDMLFCCVPEMDVYLSSNPIVCIPCIQAIINLYQFKSKCINTENIIRTFMKKFNLSDEIPVNLGAVVQDLLEINRVYKEQEERRRQMEIERQNNLRQQFLPPISVSGVQDQDRPNQSAVQDDPNIQSNIKDSLKIQNSNVQNQPYMQNHPINQNQPNIQNNSSLLLNHLVFQKHPSAHISGHQNNFLFRPEGTTSYNYSNVPNTIHDYPRMHPTNFMRFRPPIGFPRGFAPHFGPPPPYRHLGHIQPMGPPALPPPPPAPPPLMLLSRLESPTLFTNGFTLPHLPKDAPNQRNILDVLPILNQSTSNSSIEAAGVRSESNISNSQELAVEKMVESNESSVKGDKHSQEIKLNKVTCHPIERKRRLAIKLTRLDLKKIDKLPGKYCDNNEQTPMDHKDDIDPSEDVANDIEEDFPEYITGDISELRSEFRDLQNKDVAEDMPHHKNITKLFNCSCMYLTTSQTLFEGHKKKCKHSLSTVKKKMLQCPHCPHVTRRSYALAKHINSIHTKAVWFYCNKCSYRSTDKGCLRRHVKKNHQNSEGNDSTKLFCCNICDIVIATEHNFQMHMSKHDNEKPTSEANYNCIFCSYTSNDRSNYRKHVFTHSPIQLQCPNCPFSNASPYNLKYHINRFHGGAGVEAADCKSEVPIPEIVKEIKEMMDSVSSYEGYECI